MRSFAALRDGDADARSTNALLLVVNAIGIPVLVREYGEVHTPPSATVGILSAIYHASMKGGASRHVLHALESEHRRVVYHVTKQELLLVFVSDKQSCERSILSNTMTTRMLETVSAALSLLLGAQHLERLDASKQRLALSKHTEMIDYIIMNYRKDVRLLLGRPLQHIRIEKSEIDKSSKLQQGVWFRDGLVVAESVAENETRLDAVEIVILAILSECLLSRGASSTREAVKISCSSTCGDVIVKVLMESCELSAATSFAVISDNISEHELQQQWKTVWIEHISQPKSDFTSAAEKEAASGVNKEFFWTALCDFVANRMNDSSRDSRFLDCKHEDEVFTLLHHVRGPLQFFSLCVGSVRLQQVSAIGDTLYDYFASSQ